MHETVAIQGDGVAACTCAALLARAGLQVIGAPTPRTASPYLMLSSQTQTLLTDVFGGDLFPGAVPIRQRIVLWGQNQQSVLPHSGLVIDESALLQRLWANVNLTQPSSEASAAWNVMASAKYLPPVSAHAFGSRMAATYSIELASTALSETCWVESVKNGWLFLIPCGEGLGSLIAVGALTDQLLAESRLVVHQIKNLGTPKGCFPAYPRLINPLGGQGWLACGSAAIAFDPIAGEGTGHAVREGILASAVIRAADSTAAGPHLLSHYTNRMLSGFLRHLQDCSRFYAIDLSPWWKSESEMLQLGSDWRKPS